MQQRRDHQRLGRALGVREVGRLQAMFGHVHGFPKIRLPAAPRVQRHDFVGCRHRGAPPVSWRRRTAVVLKTLSRVR